MGLGLGLFTSIIVGIIAGWLADKIMKRDHGLFTNLVVGVIGGLIGGIIIQLLNIEASGGWIFSIVAATAGACILLWIVDKVKQ